jgi:hypothetical protein
LTTSGYQIAVTVSGGDFLILRVLGHSTKNPTMTYHFMVMSNISANMDIRSKHVHFFMENGFISKQIKVEAWNNSIKS